MASTLSFLRKQESTCPVRTFFVTPTYNVPFFLLARMYT
jgi:hypothetical protein